jgi:hypothetical protein
LQLHVIHNFLSLDCINFFHYEENFITRFVHHSDICRLSVLLRYHNITPPFPDGSTYQIGDIGTVKGTYTVYKFMREYKGRSKFSASPVTFHDLLAVKVDTAGVIVDAD